MKSKIYSNNILIGTSELQLTDESMGVLSGKFIPNENYKRIRETIWNFHISNSNNKFDEINRLRLNCQLENEIFLFPTGGFLITDIEELQNEDLEFEAAGIYNHVIEDNFLSTRPKERIFEPWELLTIEQKLSYENELFKEIGKSKPNGILSFLKKKKHKLSEYEFSAMAKFCRNDDVLFTIYKKGSNKFDYAVIHLTWKGKLESNKDYPRTELFEDFDHFLYHRLHADKREWEE